MKKQLVVFRLDPDTIEELKHEAKSMGATFSHYVRWLVTQRKESVNGAGKRAKPTHRHRPNRH